MWVKSKPRALISWGVLAKAIHAQEAVFGQKRDPNEGDTKGIRSQGSANHTHKYS